MHISKKRQEAIKSYLRSGGVPTRHSRPSGNHKKVFQMFSTFILDTSKSNDVIVGLG